PVRTGRRSRLRRTKPTQVIRVSSPGCWNPGEFSTAGVWTAAPAKPARPPAASQAMPQLTVARLVDVEPSRDEILKALEQVIDPELRRPVTELDMVRDVRIQGGDVAVTIALTVAGCPLRSSFEQQVAQALAPVAGVERVSLDFDVMSPDEKATLSAKL